MMPKYTKNKPMLAKKDYEDDTVLSTGYSLEEKNYKQTLRRDLEKMNKK